MYILLAIATQAYLGSYGSLDSCNNAIRERMIAEIAPPGVIAAQPSIKPQVEAIVAKLQPYQNDYQCVKK
jgi:hypothetical protein